MLVILSRDGEMLIILKNSEKNLVINKNKLYWMFLITYFIIINVIRLLMLLEDSEKIERLLKFKEASSRDYYLVKLDWSLLLSKRFKVYLKREKILKVMINFWNLKEDYMSSSFQQWNEAILLLKTNYKKDKHLKREQLFNLLIRRGPGFQEASSHPTHQHHHGRTEEDVQQMGLFHLTKQTLLTLPISYCFVWCLYRRWET